MKLKFGLIAALLFLSMSVASAEVTVKDAWVRATVAQQKATGAFLNIQSSENAKIVEIRTSIGDAEIHEMKMENNIMKMRSLEALELPAGKVVELKPGGFHIMLINLKAQVKAGDVIPLTIIVEGKNKQRQTIDIKIPAKSMNSSEMKM